MNNLNCIAKELIPQYTFVSEDVLSKDAAGRALRASNLVRAERLGNAYHGKVRITFQTLGQENVVETTVWAASHDYVSLKGGVVLPVRSISEVEFA
jgi:hypothetical protein